MLGCCSGFQIMVKEKSPKAIDMHCTLHRQTLMVKTMPDHLKNVLNDVVKAVNFIKASSLNLHLFADLYKDNGSNFEMLLLYLHHYKERTSPLSTVIKKVTALKLKLHLWHSKLECENFVPFLNLNTFLDEDALQVDANILDIMKQHVLTHHAEIQRYFPGLQNFIKVHRFITNPFAISVVDLPSEDYVIQEQFIDLLNDGGAKNTFRNMCCSEF
ncbi:protein ZBED8-like [Octopus bimaculoides]|uniref:protein ZBED8-like n=1 Tax=Octopus bimaculoides TaxID=37653 RepID=UPI0022E76198|nr:protein ZBED8-like [Octopus bimaculoides]